MGLIGDLAGSAIDSLTGAESHSTIDKFMAKFNNSAQHYVDQIDTLNTFDCTFEFYPGINTESKKEFGDKLLDKGKDLLMNAANNATGGIVDKLLNTGKGKGIIAERDSAKKDGGDKTFMTYLVKANLIDTAIENERLVFDMSYYIQNVQVPMINIQTGETINSPVGKFTVTGDCVTPQSNTLNMEIINTKAPIIERLIYPWMREIALPIWSYETQPYTTANITLSMTKHADIKYLFINARPTNIDTYHPSQELNGTPTRNVMFVFDYMFINSNLDTMESLSSALGGLAKGVVNDVAGTFGL